MEDTKEKILEEWNTAWSSPPLNKMEVAKKMQFSDIDDLYRHLLGIAKKNGNPQIGKGKKQLRINDQKLRLSGSWIGGKEVNGKFTLFPEHWSEEKKSSNPFKITTDFLVRIRKWKKYKRSTI